MDRKISYKREMKHNYLMIEGDPDQENNYETRMLISNPIEGLLRFRMKKVDALCYYCYEITSRQPLSRLLENKCIKATEIRQMMMDIAHTLTGMEEYLLKEEQILLEPEFIYVEPDLFGVELCLLPGRKGDFPNEMSKLLEYLLGKVDYQDKNGVVMVYGLYRESLKENYGMDNLFRLLVNGEEVKEEQSREHRAEEERGEEGNKVLKEVPKIVENKEKIGKKWLEIEIKNVIIIKTVIILTVMMLGSQILLWLLTGTEGFRQYGIFVAAGESALMVIWRIIRKTEELQEKPLLVERVEATPWQMVFKENQSEKQGQIPVDTSNTILLLDMEEQKELRKLAGMEADTPNISVSYYPFIIGKQENLVDYMFAKDTVSRLHLRLDEKDGIFNITDLNSTNGTLINGRLLEANETLEVRIGDEVSIANYRFQFL